MKEQLLVAKIVQGLQLNGKFFIDGEDLVLEDDDKNPTIRIHFDQRRVVLFHEGNIKEIILAGLRRYAEEAGFAFEDVTMEPQPSRQMLAFKRLLEGMRESEESEQEKSLPKH